MQIPGPQHVGQMGRIDGGSLERLQDAWIAERLVRTRTPIADIVDTAIADEARRDLGLR